MKSGFSLYAGEVVNLHLILRPPFFFLAVLRSSLLFNNLVKLRHSRLRLIWALSAFCCHSITGLKDSSSEGR
jgi:hypothetical protein